MTNIFFEKKTLSLGPKPFMTAETAENQHESVRGSKI